MRCLLALILILLPLGNFLAAYDFKLSGDPIISSTEVQEALGQISEQDSEAESSGRAMEILIRLAEERGYFDALFGIHIVADSAVHIDINAGSLYHINRLEFSARGHVPEGLERSIADEYHNKPATREIIQSILIKAVDLYIDNGYPFAQSKLLTFERQESARMNLVIEMVSGPYITVDSLQFASEHGISNSFLTRRSGWSRGDGFSQTKLDNSIRSLNSLGYLKITQPPEEKYYNNYSSCLLIYNLEPQTSNRIEGALGYNPGTENRDGFLFGFLDLAFFNPLGDGKSFFIEWNKPNESGSRLGLRFDYPYPFGSGLETSFQVSQERFSDYYLSLAAGMNVYQNFDINNRLELGLRWTKITAEGDLFRSVYDSRVYEASLGIRLSDHGNDSRDISGRELKARLIYLHKRLYPTLGRTPDDNSYDPVKAELSFRLGLPLSRIFYTDLKAQFEGFSEDEALISPAEMIRLGGRRTLRGYSEEQFLTPRVVWSNCEFGVYGQGLFKGYLFADLGYARLSDIYAAEDIPIYENRFLFGAGFGFKLFSGQTGLDLNVGWSRDDSLAEGKLYMIVENRF
jgi:outer membrane protein assembly factor BamA